MKLQIKVSGSISNLMNTPSKVKLTGKLDVITLYNSVCNDSTFFVNGKFNGVVFKGKELQAFETEGDVIVTGDITDLEFLNSKGEVVKRYYISDCIIQLIDVDEEPDYEIDD